MKESTSVFAMLEPLAGVPFPIPIRQRPRMKLNGSLSLNSVKGWGARSTWDAAGARSLSILAQRGWDVTGVEYSETALEMARSNAQAAEVNIKVIRADAAKPLPIGDNTFDLVLDNHVRHCLIGRVDRMAFLANAYTALKDGGTIFSANMSCDGVFAPSAASVPIDPHTRTDLHDTRYWASLSELLDELSASGFVVEMLRLEQEPQACFCSTAIMYGMKQRRQDK